MLTTPTAISVKAGGGFERAVLLPGLTLAACAAASWQVPEIQEMVGSVAESLTGDPAEADS